MIASLFPVPVMLNGTVNSTLSNSTDNSTTSSNSTGNSTASNSTDNGTASNSTTNSTTNETIVTPPTPNEIELALEYFASLFTTTGWTSDLVFDLVASVSANLNNDHFFAWSPSSFVDPEGDWYGSETNYWLWSLNNLKF